MIVPPVAHFWLDGKPLNDEQEIILAQLGIGSPMQMYPRVGVTTGEIGGNDGRGTTATRGPFLAFQHLLRFLGQPEALLYTREVTFLRAGGLYFFWNFEDEPFVIYNKLSSDITLENLRGNGQPIASPGNNCSETGQNEVIQFHHLWDSEKENGRNRWVELQEKEGKPHHFLLAEVTDMEDDDAIGAQYPRWSDCTL
jgi:hypothetical protein